MNKQEIQEIPENILKRRWRILSVLCMSLLIVMLANSGLNLALPSMAKDLNLSSTQIVWIVDIYALVFASMLFTMGTLGDKFGRKGIMQIGQFIFVLAAAYAAFVAKSGAELIGARGVMGIGAAMVMPSTLSIITNVFPRNERSKAIAMWSGVAGGGMAIGSIISGLLLEYFSWHSTFVFSIALGVLAIILNKILVPTSRDPEQPAIDWGGAFLSIIGLLGLVYGIIEAPTEGLHEAKVFIPLVVGVIALIGFVFWELRVKQPMLDMQLFKHKAFSISTLSLLLVFFSLMGVFFSLSQLFQFIIGYTPFESTVRMLPISLVMMIIAPLSPLLVKKIGVRWTVFGGLAIVSIGFVFMSLLPDSPSYIQVLTGLLTVMAGMAVTMSPTTNMLMSAVPKNRAGMGSAMNDTTRELGGALGIAVLGATISAAYSDKIAPALGALPEQARAIAEQSLAGAMAIGGQMGPAGAQFIDQAKAAWMGGLTQAMVIGAVICGITAVLVAILLPHKHSENEDDSYADTLEREEMEEKENKLTA